jgi:hypothetical protein
MGGVGRLVGTPAPGSPIRLTAMRAVPGLRSGSQDVGRRAGEVESQAAWRRRPSAPRPSASLARL